jgi:hypothetical protein
VLDIYPIVKLVRWSYRVNHSERVCQNPTTIRMCRRVTKWDNISNVLVLICNEQDITIIHATYNSWPYLLLYKDIEINPLWAKQMLLRHYISCGTGIIPDSLSHIIDNNYIDSSILVKECAEDWLTRVVLNYLTQPFSASAIYVVRMRENSLLRVPWSVIAKAEHSITGHAITHTLVVNTTRILKS